jgi:hypothetical protein
VSGWEALAWLGAAVAADHATDPDAPGLGLRTAERELSCKGTGYQWVSRVRYPGFAGEQWPDAARLPRFGGNRAWQRRCSATAIVPPGTIVVRYRSSVWRYTKRRAEVAVAVVVRAPDGSGARLATLPHRALRSTPAYVTETPARGEIRIERRRSAA